MQALYNSSTKVNLIKTNNVTTALGLYEVC